MRHFWMLYKKGMKQKWHVPVIIAAVICVSLVYELYLKSSHVPQQVQWAFELLANLISMTIIVAPIMLFDIFRDDWSRKTVVQVHSLPVKRSRILLSRLGIIYTVSLITISLLALRHYLTQKNATFLNGSISLFLGVAIGTFLVVGIFSICIAVAYSIHRNRQITGVLIGGGLFLMTSMFDFNFIGSLSRNLNISLTMTFVAVLYHVIALVIYGKYAEV